MLPYISKNKKPIAFCVITAILMIEGVVAIWFRHNDYRWHFWMGEAFLTGDLSDASGQWYPLGRAMMNALPAWVGYRTGRFLCYIMAIGMLALIVKFWKEILFSNRSRSDGIDRSNERSDSWFWSVVVGSAILYPYVIRDLDDCGANLFLLFLLTSTIHSIVRGRNLLAGLSLATAITYKITPVYLLVFCLWKGKWKTAVWTIAFVSIWNLSPALWIGWDQTTQWHEKTFEIIRKSSKTGDYSQNPFEPPRHQNQALPFSAARYLQSYSSGEDLYLDHPWFVQFGDFSPQRASAFIRIGILLLGCAIAFPTFNKRSLFQNKNHEQHSTDRHSKDRLGIEWAALTGLLPLMSPLCWLQHLVLILPAFWIVTHQAIYNTNRIKLTRLLLVCIGFVTLILQRDVVGRELSILVLSYKLDTFCVLSIILVVLFSRWTIPLTETSLNEKEQTDNASIPSDHLISSEESKAA